MVNNNDNQVNEITDAQVGIHKNLESVVAKHFKTANRKPIAAHTQNAFDAIKHDVEYYIKKDTPLLFDSFCGTAISTRLIAQKNPNALVIGIDRSAHRLSKDYKQSLPENALLVHAECADFWHLAVEAGWKLQKHYILYPNPYPKSKHLKRRVHAHPSYPTLLKLGGMVELRSNWNVYVEEFCKALEYAQMPLARCYGIESIKVDEPLTLFEKKYKEAGQDLYRCKYSLY